MESAVERAQESESSSGEGEALRARPSRTRAVSAGAKAPGTVRQGRSSRVRARTVSIKRMPKSEIERGRSLPPEPMIERPSTRSDCMQGANAMRPCPFVSCKHHLFLDVSDRTGSIKLNFPDLEVWELAESCALDIADRGGVTLEDVGQIMNLTRERIRQLETRGVERLRALADMASLRDYCE